MAAGKADSKVGSVYEVYGTKAPSTSIGKITAGKLVLPQQLKGLTKIKIIDLGRSLVIQRI